jgi:hypothetical protein
MQTADFNHNDFRAGNEQEADRALLVRFMMREKQDQTASRAEGRPIFKDTEYIEIRVAGKRDPQVCRPARQADKDRFPEHYRRFQLRMEEPTEGTPLSQWPMISRSQCEELSFFSIKTVEQLAEMADSNCSNIRGGLDLKYKAIGWLEKADESKLLAEKEQLQQRVDDQAAQIEQLQAQMNELLAAKAVDKPAATTAPKKRAGRPRKTAVKAE